MNKRFLAMILVLVMLFAYNSVATGYVAGTASHTTLYADAITGKSGSTVRLNDNMAVSGLVSVSNTIVASNNGNIGRLAYVSGSLEAGVTGHGNTYGIYGTSAAGEGVRGTHINDGGTYGVLGEQQSGVFGASGTNIGRLGLSGGIGASGSGSTRGISGNSVAGEGVKGTNTNTGNYGILGHADYGVRGEHARTGYYAILGTENNGVRAIGNYAITGQNSGNNAISGTLGSPDYGASGSYSNRNYGSLGTVNYGAYGYHDASGNYGYLGSANYGIYGSASGMGYAIYGNNNGHYGYIGASSHGAFAQYDANNYAYLGTNGLGVSARGTVNGIYASTSGTYGINTPDKIRAGNGVSVGGDCTDSTGIAVCDINDVAEDIYSKEELEDGDVVVIDTENVEHVKLSRKPYDTLAAGIISSNPAFHIESSRTGVPLALAGRVKAKASAENGAIKIGDLLTTSSTPGHLMRCEIKDKCFGAVVGKALEPLASGKGKITVLVMLA